MSRRRPPTPAELLAAGGPLAGIAIMIAMHWLQPDLDPAREPVSNFAVHGYGFLLGVALFSLSAGAIGLSIALRTRSRSVWGPRLLWVAAVGFVLGAIFPITEAAMHALGAGLGFGGLIGAMAVLGRAFRRERRGLRGLGTVSLVLFVPAFLLWLGYGNVDPEGSGTYQRVFLATTFGWLLIAGLVTPFAPRAGPGRPI